MASLAGGDRRWRRKQGSTIGPPLQRRRGEGLDLDAFVAHTEIAQAVVQRLHEAWRAAQEERVVIEGRQGF